MGKEGYSLRGFIFGNERLPITIWTIVHVLFGIACWWIGLNFLWTTGISCAFEILEQTSYLTSFFDWLVTALQAILHFQLWGDYRGDSIANSYCDVFGAMVGWLLANWLWG